MTFPASPANGDLYQINGYTFTYVSTQNQWVGTMPTSGAVVSGGGGYPTSKIVLQAEVRLSNLLHDGGTTNHYMQSGFDPNMMLKYNDIDYSVDNQSSIQWNQSGSNYGSAIDISGGANVDPSVPRFDTTAEYLASNPTWVDYGNGNGAVNGAFYSEADQLFYFTNDQGATWGTSSPELFINGIEIAQAGRYKVKVKETFEMGGSIPSASIKGVTLLFRNDDIAHKEYFRAPYMIVSGSSSTAVPFLNHEFELFLDCEAGDILSLGSAKLGASRYSYHNYTFSVETDA